MNKCHNEYPKTNAKGGLNKICIITTDNHDDEEEYDEDDDEEYNDDDDDEEYNDNEYNDDDGNGRVMIAIITIMVIVKVILTKW